ncbi:hypothetical protein PybrP1_011734 [[Pythium] brassicae (nom. inval.)]|nr:hypothetical protein PybrP1_011734 [[Pythium] brassicae (nom. inval.)]
MPLSTQLVIVSRLRSLSLSTPKRSAPVPAGGNWIGIASRIDQPRPSWLPRANFDMVIETGRAFTKTPLQKITTALLERTTDNILGGVYPFKPFDALASKFYLDISNVDSDIDTNLMLHCLFLLGCQPVYDAFHDVNLATGHTSATWRVFLRSDKCLPPLLVNGSVCDQVIFGNKLHPAHGKDPSFRGSTGKISPLASVKSKAKPMLMLTDGFTTVGNKKKRPRGGVDFANMLKKQVLYPLDGIATKN